MNPDIVCGCCTAPALRSVACPASHRACSRLDGIEPLRLGSFTYAWDASGILALSRGPGIATPASLLPSDIAPRLRPLSSTGITRRLQYYEPLRHPAGPACPSRDSGWCVHTTDRASRVASIPLLHACRRQYPGGTGWCVRRSLPCRWQPSPYYRRVGFRITLFEACSAFTRVAARMFAEPPMAALLFGVLQTMSLPPSPAPTATGWSDSCRAGFAPAEE